MPLEKYDAVFKTLQQAQGPYFQTELNTYFTTPNSLPILVKAFMA